MAGSIVLKILCILPLLFSAGYAWVLPNPFAFNPWSKYKKSRHNHGLPGSRGHGGSQSHKKGQSHVNKPAVVVQVNKPAEIPKPAVQATQPVVPQQQPQPQPQPQLQQQPQPQPQLQQPQAQPDDNDGEKDKAVDAQTGFAGKWELFKDNAGISAMHLILLPKINKVLMYDATVWKSSKMPMPIEMFPCRLTYDEKKRPSRDCWIHSILLDHENGQIIPNKLQTDTWCSSGGLTINGTLVSTGGWQSGRKTTRFHKLCDGCDWTEYPETLLAGRWYSTQVTLPDGNFLVVGGRDSYSYEFIAPEGQRSRQLYQLPFLEQTTDFGINRKQLENNLYPFVYLNTDGNIFLFANNRSILLDPYNNKVVREYPILPGGSRSYPASGMSVLLPIRLFVQNPKVINAEVLVCGGAAWDAYLKTDVPLLEQRQFPPALSDCGRMQLNKPNPFWRKENMPTPRVMGDMANLPTGEVLIVNGAKKGTSAWEYAEEPNKNPVIYNPKAPAGQRFKELLASDIPRMYHSSMAVLPDGKILVAGSNTNDGYVYKSKYPTDTRVEKFSPPYLDPQLAHLRQEINVDATDKEVGYGKKFTVQVKSKEQALNRDDLKVTLYSPAFTTHGISMNQRLMVLGIADIQNNVVPGTHNIYLMSPPSNTIAPPGYYLLYVVYKGIPGVGKWIQIKP